MTPARVVANLWRPGALGWISSIRRLGVTSHARVDQPQPFPTPGALDCPGHPVPVPTPGHTSGHTAFYLPQHGVVITGDALVTGHAISRRTGPQLLPGLFHHDRAAATESLHTFAALDADTVLPGHGAAHRGHIADAVANLLG
ncbi:MBL fold metallo-hydrolase [Streptomyces shenzhenensis]|uniref:MBL fold metallo-hydrolase n=1 Tax=Streptomyces shenzhenensis TaxID=943815 RepID=UPI00381CFCC0